MEFDFDAAHRGCTADAVDFRAASVVTLDGKTFCDRESVYVQVKGTAVFTVEKEEVSVQKAPHKKDLALVYKRKIQVTLFEGI